METLKKALLFIGTWLATTSGVVLDELMKIPEGTECTTVLCIGDISQQSLAIAVILGGGTAWALLKAWLTTSPKDKQ